jgi:hypothetical protein
MKKVLIAIILIATTFILSAQNEVDALRYSQQDIFGNARFAAMSGAFGALGGEFSSLSYNPAGIGMYQFSEFTLTPSLNYNSTKSYYNGSNFGYNKTGLSISNLGLVFILPKNNSEWKRINIAIGWNQLANYDQNIKIQGENSTSSLVDNILDYAQGNTIDNLNAFHGAPAFWSDLIDLANNSIDTTTDWYANDNGNYISHISSNTNKGQSKYIKSTGEENEFVFSVGGSYNEQIYLGATIGFPTINYYENSTYNEHSFEDTINGLHGFDYEEELSVYGSGINLKVGAIYRATDQIKVGVSLHSPTLYSIEETYNTLITTHFDYESYTETSPINYFEYELLTPWKAIVSASTIFNKNIIISADYEIIDYTFSQMSSSDYAFENENENIKNLYQRTENIRLGAEVNIKPFVLRSGYAKYGSAFANKDFSRENFSFGIGINNGGYFFDVAYVLSQGMDEHKLYSEDYIAPVDLVNTNHNLIFTLGFRY